MQAMQGQQSAFSFALCTEVDGDWQGVLTKQRRRIEVKTVLQQKQPSFDERLLKRARLLPERQRDAMIALGKLRERQVKISPIAVQFEIEFAFEVEFPTKEFDLPQFYQQAWNWNQHVTDYIQGIEV